MTDHRTRIMDQMLNTLAEAETRSGLCANINAVGNPDIWAQYVDGQINIASRSTTFPAETIAAVGEAEIIEFEPGTYLTVLAPSRAPGDVAAWICDWFQQDLGRAKSWR
ncbi:MAG: hypothetical protein HZY74_13305 [Brevundimonas sp.]|nr:MAG: hypothetical protein HZY74_13305 [Brevundimonas sp.]